MIQESEVSIMAKKTASLANVSKDPLADMKRATTQRKAEKITTSDADLKNFNTRLPADLLKRMRIYCAENEISIQDFVRDAVQARLEA